MSIFVLTTGVVHRDPEQRLSANGKSYTTARLRCPTRSKDGGDTTTWVSIVAFAGAARDVLEGLKAGDAVSVGGRATLVTWEKGGAHGVGLDLVADTIASAKPSPSSRGRDAKAAKPKVGDQWKAAGVPFDDELPF